MPNAPATGVALILTHGRRVLIGKRRNPPMAHSWQFPGGWIKHGESPEQAVTRVASMFPALEHEAPQFETFTSNLFENGLHSVSLYFSLPVSNADSIDLTLNHDCDDWMWVDWYDLPRPLFLPLDLLNRSGYSPYDEDA